LELYGVGENTDILGLNVVDFIHADDRAKAIINMSNVMKGIYSEDNVYRLKKKNGTVVWGEIKASVLLDEKGLPQGMVAITRDITQRKMAEQALREREQDYRTLTQNMPGLVYRVHIKERNRMQFFNDRLEAITGYNESELIEGAVCSIDPIIMAEDRESVINAVRDAVMNGRSFKVEYRLQHKNGKIVYVTESGQPVPGPDGRPLHIDGIIFDATEVKIAELELKERESRLRLIFDILPVGLWFADKDGRLVTGNPAGVAIWGAEPHASFEEYGIFKARRLPDGEMVLPDDWALAHTIKEGVTIKDELLEIDAFDGKKRTILNYTAPILDENGHIQGAIVVNNDITDRYRAEELVKASLKEKEVMLKEIHHRVKNNLQIIASLLNLQTGYVKDEKYKKMFLESQNRVRSMALVHEKLYKSKDLSGIDFSEYINGLMSDLYSAYGITQNEVALAVDVLKDKIPIDIAIPCGLIINELATNSFKYAFKDKKGKGRISITFKRDDSGLYTLEVGDNGPGIGRDVDLKTAPTLGLQLVDALVGQLDASIRISNEGGARVIIEFKT